MITVFVIGCTLFGIIGAALEYDYDETKTSIVLGFLKGSFLFCIPVLTIMLVGEFLCAIGVMVHYDEDFAKAEKAKAEQVEKQEKVIAVEDDGFVVNFDALEKILNE